MAGEPVLVAADFTARELRLLLGDPGGAALAEGAWPLPPLADEGAWAWEVGGRIAALFAAEGGKRSALAIAVAAPGAVDPREGRIAAAPGQPECGGLAAADALRRHFGAPVACESRTLAALEGERWLGAAQGLDDVLYVSLRGAPRAAAACGGRPLRGAGFAAGALPAMPELDPAEPIGDGALETAAGLLADASALLDPAAVVIDGAEQHLRRLVPLLRRVLAEAAPGPRVAASALGDRAALAGAARMAAALALEGGRR